MYGPRNFSSAKFALSLRSKLHRLWKEQAATSFMMPFKYMDIVCSKLWGLGGLGRITACAGFGV